MKKEEFEQLVSEAVDSLPQEFKNRIHNLVFIVEEEEDPYFKISPDGLVFSRLLGLYHGIPYRHRGYAYGNVNPDVITIFQKPIESICRTYEEIRKKIREVVYHEVGHYFGLSEEDLKKIEGR